ncbi:MAG TPA: NAD(P)/FAD-dependent oxidoreductase [Acidiferrobacterales bacterium]|nr:NAD(P)/FAD-dependent oxidoreductase [Acidiferrobacterales bacterium]
MESCDVLIVGGGPAGTTLAWKLKAAGLDVLILDKKTFPRDKTCAGWITPAVVETLKLDTADYAQGRVFQPIRRFVTGTIGGDEVHTEYGTTVSYGIRRFEFDDYLLQRCGARVVLGEPLKSLKHEGDGWVVNGKLHAPLVVGAGGHFCPVARYLGANLGADEKIIAAQEIEFEMSAAQQRACNVAEDRPELYFCADLKGYGWIFRKGNFLNIGLGREDNHRLAEHVSAFCEGLKQQGRIPADIPGKFHGHAYLLYPLAPRQLVDDGLLLIGDAAGLAYPQSGEGIRPAIESAILAADAILAAHGNPAVSPSNRYQRAQLEPYVAQLTARFGERLQGETPAAPGRFVQRFKETLAHWLLRRGWFARHVVIDRWFLHRQQPPLPS